MFLLQFDACNRDLLGLSSVGFVLYYDSVVLWKHYSLMTEAYNSNYAEYKAIVCALQFAISLNIQYIYIQGDAKIVIDQINNICKAKSKIIQPLLNEVNKLKTQFKFINFEHIYRKDNIFADSLANQALYNYYK